MFENIWYFIGWSIILILSKLMLKKTVFAYAPIPKGPKILVANHPTVSDPFILFTTLRERMSILILGKVFTIPIFGTYLKMAGHIPVIQGNGKKAFDQALNFLNRGISVLIFVEGEISPDLNKYAKPKSGAVRLAYQSGAPIIPIGVSLHKKNIHHINGIIDGEKIREKWYFHGKYAITIGKYLHIHGDSMDKIAVQKHTNQIMELISKLASESASRIRA